MTGNLTNRMGKLRSGARGTVLSSPIEASPAVFFARASIGTATREAHSQHGVANSCDSSSPNTDNCVVDCVRASRRGARQESPLTPELKDFIDRVVVPILVKEYLAAGGKG